MVEGQSVSGWNIVPQPRRPSQATADSQLRQTQSEFEAQVLQALHAKGVHTVPQYPACGFFIDIVATLENQRLAIECDGELWHLDEHGRLKQEDCVRQEILERAGWRVLRIPYRGWRRDPAAHIQRVTAALTEIAQDSEETPEALSTDKAHSLKLSIYEAAIIHALAKGAKDREAVLRAARLQLGYARLGPAIRHSLENAMTVLTERGYINLEDGEFFASEQARTAKIVTTQITPPPSPGSSSRRFRPRGRYRRW